MLESRDPTARSMVDCDFGDRSDGPPRPPQADATTPGREEISAPGRQAPVANPDSLVYLKRELASPKAHPRENDEFAQ